MKAEYNIRCRRGRGRCESHGATLRGNPSDGISSAGGACLRQSFAAMRQNAWTRLTARLASARIGRNAGPIRNGNPCRCCAAVGGRLYGCGVPLAGTLLPLQPAAAGIVARSSGCGFSLQLHMRLFSAGHVPAENTSTQPPWAAYTSDAASLVVGEVEGEPAPPRISQEW